MPFFVRLFARVFTKTMRISGAEALSVSSNIFVGGTGALAPSRLRDISRIGLKSLLAATLACLMTGAVAGTFYTGGSLLFGK